VLLRPDQAGEKTASTGEVVLYPVEGQIVWHQPEAPYGHAWDLPRAGHKKIGWKFIEFA
jgi:hypothetical protein